MGRMLSPRTQTNWEGVGVAPDVSVPAGKALLTARLEALRRLETASADPRERAELEQARAAVIDELARFRPVRFELRGHAEAREVVVAGSFNSWSARRTPMVRRGGRWTAEVELEPGRHVYKFVVDGRWIPDPANPQTDGAGDNVNSVRSVH